MSPSELAELFDNHPTTPFRLTLASGDVVDSRWTIRRARSSRGCRCTSAKRPIRPPATLNGFAWSRFRTSRWLNRWTRAATEAGAGGRHLEKPFPLGCELAMTTLDLHDPANTLARIVERVRGGEEIIIAEEGTPLAKIIPVAPERSSRENVLGMWKDKVWIAEDFTAPLPEDELREWEK
jgi:prevent-host-death family protein